MRQKGNTAPEKQIAFMKIIYLAFFFFFLLWKGKGLAMFTKPGDMLKLWFSSSDSKESACNTGDPGFIPELGRSPGEGNGYQPQYSCLQNSMDREVWQATVHGAAKSRTLLRDVVQL